MSDYSQVIKDIKIVDLKKESDAKKEDGSRFVQILCTKTDNGYDLLYSFMKDGCLESLKLSDITSEDVVPSITDNFIAAFVFENEIHDLFGINIKDIAIDFKGTFYNVAQDKPMTILDPETIARKEKQKKIDAAMAAKKAKDAAAGKSEKPATKAGSSAAKPAAKPADKAPEKPAKETKADAESEKGGDA